MGKRSICCCSVAVMSSSLQARGLQHTRLPCPSLSPWVCSDSCPLSLWCYLTCASCFFFLPSVFASIRVFSNESGLCIRWTKYWNCNIRPSNEYSGLISFRIDWFDLLAVQGTLKSLLQHREGINSSVLSLLCGSTFTSIYDYWKNHSFDLQTFVMKVMSLIFNMLSSFVLETFFQGVSIF